MTVGPDGCELDSDGDGVANSSDDCPNTARGARIDSRGCDLKEEIRLRQPTFDSDSDQLKLEVFVALDGQSRPCAGILAFECRWRDSPMVRAPTATTLSLSQRRAEVVRRHLVERGVTNTLQSAGYCESEPVADNGTEAGRAMKRRVVLRIILPQGAEDSISSKT